MSIRINRDQAAANNTRRIDKSYGSLMKTMEKLSSGLPTSRVSDDPAGLGVSEKMRARIAALNQEIEDTTHSIKKYAAADATIGELRSNLTELRTQALGASGEGFTFDAVHADYQEAAKRAASNYNRAVKTADYNGSSLFDGSEGALMKLSSLEEMDLSTPEAAEQSIRAIDDALSRLDAARNEIGSVRQNDLEMRRSNLEVTAQNLTASESPIRDADIMVGVAQLTRDQIPHNLQAAFQAHANLNQETVRDLFS